MRSPFRSLLWGKGALVANFAKNRKTKHPGGQNITRERIKYTVGIRIDPVALPLRTRGFLYRRLSALDL